MSVHRSDPAVLDDPVGESLRHQHAHLARGRGRALSYHCDVATFSAVPTEPERADWSDLAALLGPGGFADLFSSAVRAPSDWDPVFSMTGRQMVADRRRFALASPDPDIVELGTADVPGMLDLASRTRPGPFWPGTHRMGRYVGIRIDGQLVAMAGERLHPPGWTEISAVCTAPESRGQGYAARLVRDVAACITARGEQPFLHVASDNTAASGLYERLGFRIRKEVVFHGHLAPRGH